MVALTHDPKLDDMVLLEALKSPALCIGALGSRGNTAARKQRLALFDLTPAEIAVSIAAEVVAVKNGMALLQKKEGSALPSTSTPCPSARADAAACIVGLP